MNDGTIQTNDIDQLDGDYWDRNLETNYTQPSRRRHFSLEVGDATFYVDPVEMSKTSPYFELLTTSRHFVEGIRGSSRLHDRSDEIACMLKSICPTVYDIYPCIIRVQSIPALARLADKYDLKRLQHCCEYFALRANFKKCGNNDLVKLLQTAIVYNYDSKLRENLINELMNRSQFLDNSVNNEMTKEICTIIIKHSLKHHVTNMLGGVCHSCGQQKAMGAIIGNCCCMWQCKRCHSVYCLKCALMPCMVEVEGHLRNAFEKYEMEGLKKEIESEITAKRS
uniref:BTB domain-containing protein n=1 Tax=Elaeophora elaphi TaxID=1147741 RepID=A0A0R3RLY4_9BILA